MSRPPGPARSALAAALLLAAGGLAYANALDLPFLFDDHPAIERNAAIRSLSLRTIFAPPRDTPVAGRPLVNASLALDYAWGGLDPRGYHAVNLAIHLACALLLYGLVRRTLSTSRAVGALGAEAWGVALATAALWVVHPLTSECVDYVTQRTESMMALCYLATLLGVAGAATAGSRTSRRAAAVAALAACALGMTAKETMATAPFVALLYDTTFHAGSVGRALRSRPALYAGLAASLLLLLGLVAASPRAGSVGVSLGVTPWTYLLNQAWVVAAYLQRVVWPHPLVLDYGWPRPLALRDVIAPALLVGGAVLASLVTAWRRPALGFPALAAFLILAPTSTFVPIATEVGTERRMYLPLAGFLLLGVLAGRAALARLPASSQTRRGVAVALLGASVLGLAGLTRARNEAYRSEEGIWRSTLAVFPDNPRAVLNLGEVLRQRGDLDGAEALFERALALHPRYGRALAHLGLVALDRGDAALAEERLRVALELEPRMGDVRTNLGELLARSGRTAEAVAVWREALDRNPDLALAANNLAWVLATSADATLRDPAAAVELAERAARRSAYTDPGVLDTLAAAYAAAGRWEEARDAGQRALSLAEERGDAALAAAIAARLDRYRRREPYVAEPPAGRR